MEVNSSLFVVASINILDNHPLQVVPAPPLLGAAGVGNGGPGHGPVFGTPFGPNLNSVSGSVSVHLGHGSVRS